MPLYFFHIRDGWYYSTDELGIELPDLSTALTEAAEGARELLAEKVRKGYLIGREQFEITDDQNRVLEVVKFRDLIRLS